MPLLQNLSFKMCHKSGIRKLNWHIVHGELNGAAACLPLRRSPTLRLHFLNYKLPKRTLLLKTSYSWAFLQWHPRPHGTSPSSPALEDFHAIGWCRSRKLRLDRPWGHRQSPSSKCRGVACSFVDSLRYGHKQSRSVKNQNLSCAAGSCSHVNS